MHFTAIMGLKITRPPPNYDKQTRTNDYRLGRAEAPRGPPRTRAVA
ncbi:hypothetical protein [Streptomyces sp. NPDC046685]